MLVQFGGISLACIPGGTMDVAPYSCKRGGITSTVFGIEVGKFFGNLPASTKTEGSTTTEIFLGGNWCDQKNTFLMRLLKYTFLILIHSDFFKKIDLHT